MVSQRRRGFRGRVLLVGGVAIVAILSAAAVVNGMPKVHRHAVAAPASAPPASNPLDPLSGAEIDTAVRTIEHDNRFPAGAYFPIVTLKEPAKSDVLAWAPGQPFARQAFANAYDPGRNRLYEAVVDVRAKTVISWAQKAGAQPAIYLTEFADADAIVRADPRFAAAMSARGINPEDVYIDVWAPGDISGVTSDPGARLMRAIAFYSGALPNPYDRPIEGVTFTLDMNKRKVISVVDTGARPVNTTVSGDASTQRTDLSPLVVKQPGGPGFQIDGRDVTWQHWHFRIDYSTREGLVLHRVGYEQNGVVRPIIYRMALDEIYVPYGLPDVNWAWRSAFDVGEYNLGQYAEPLEKNVDVPDNAVFFDEVVGSDTGSVDGSYALPHATALYERDAGSLWDRTDPTTFARDARFGRELVVTAAYVIGNYTYATEYAFRLDGSIGVTVGATGTTLNQGVATTADGDRFGSTVTTNIAAPNHQHFFNFRIDFDVDGTSNNVAEQNIAHTSDAAGNGFAAQTTSLTTEQSRDTNPSTVRSWVVQSTSRTNALGEPTGYAVVPRDTVAPLSTATYGPLLRAPFAQHSLWLTRQKDGELFAAGDYPNQAAAGGGLTAYAASPESVKNKDLVVWYTTGFTHHPEMEEYPVMSTERVGFQIKPDGFFDSYPALDVPTQP
jgi:primary-amine oxidase